MNKQTTRAFSAGILFTAVFIFLYNLYFHEAPLQDSTSIPEGSIVVNESEVQEKEKEISVLKEQLERYKSEKGKEEDARQTDKYQLTLTIKPGMTPGDIEEKLKDANIISEDEDFVQFIVDNEYADKIQIGDFLVNSEMTEEEIANTIIK
jgi:hypothetical protein